MKKIKLTRNKCAIVDDDVYERLGAFSWHCTDHGYVARRSTDNTHHYLHRDIMGPEKGMVVDHINGDRLDNRRENLRIVSQRENTWNSTVARGAVPYRGVYIADSQAKKEGWNLKKKYAARIMFHGNYVWLGRFTTPEEARDAYEAAKEKYHAIS
jgi:hypothetical protein